MSIFHIILFSVAGAAILWLMTILFKLIKNERKHRENIKKLPEYRLAQHIERYNESYGGDDFSYCMNWYSGLYELIRQLWTRDDGYICAITRETVESAGHVVSKKPVYRGYLLDRNGRVLLKTRYSVNNYGNTWEIISRMLDTATPEKYDYNYLIKVK